MHNPFTKHPKENGYSGFFSHFVFAASISLRLTAAAATFFMHAFFPFVPIPKFLNLEMTIQYLIRKNLDTL